MPVLNETQASKQDRGQRWSTGVSAAFVPSLGVGVASGVFGLAYGTIAGILIHSSSPRLYATLSGVQFGATGTSFFFVRSLLLNRDTVLSPDNPSHRVVASGIAGSFAGIIYSAFVPSARRRGGILLVGSFSILSQLGLNSLDYLRARRQPAEQGQHRFTKWNPFQALSDQEYEDILQNKLLRIEAEIALVDDQIADLRIAKEQAKSIQIADVKEH